MSGTSLVNLGDITKPATVLIEKISDAIGGLAQPWQIQRIANAEAKADLIRAESKIEISALERRAIERMVREEGKKQENIEDIAAKAIDGLNIDSKPENIEKDWITYFFERARLVSDKTMQELWAKALSGEANSPGKFSKRTIDVISSLDKSDADLFSNLSYTIVFGFGRRLSIVLEGSSSLEKVGIGFESLSHLESLGLIQQNNLGYNLDGVKGSQILTYGDDSFFITIPNGISKISIGSVLLTRIGQQILDLSSPNTMRPYMDELFADWEKQGLSPKKTGRFVTIPTE